MTKQRDTSILHYLYDDFKLLETYLTDNDITNFGFFIGLKNIHTDEEKLLVMSAGSEIKVLLENLECLKKNILNRSNQNNNIKLKPDNLH